MLLEWQPNASTFTSSVCKAMGKRSLTGLHHRRAEDMQRPSSHLTKPFLFSQQRERETELCKEMSDPKERRDMQCHCQAIRILILFNQRPHLNVHKPLPAHLQWSVQSCKTAGIPNAPALSPLRFSVDHLWLTQLGESTGWCLLLVSVSHWLNHWMQYVNEVQSNHDADPLSSANETKAW